MVEDVREKLKRCNRVEDFQKLPDKEVKEILEKDTSDMLKDNNVFLGRNKDYKFEIFNLPRVITCPEATLECKSKCYQIKPEKMHKGKDQDSAVVAYRKMNLLKSLQDDFVDNMVNKIKRFRPNKGENIIIRIHASGDFYSEEYMRKWFEIALNVKKKCGKEYKFVAYTKSMNILKSVMDNKKELDVIYNKVCGCTLQEYNISNFNIKLIGSIMDDTGENPIIIMDDYNLPKYFVTKNEINNLKDCEEKSCAECKECYKESFKYSGDIIYTRLRE